MANKRFLFVGPSDASALDTDSAVRYIEVDDLVLVRGGEAVQLTEDQERRVRDVAPPNSIRAESGSDREEK